MDAMDVMQKYAALLEAAPGPVHPESMLPYPKPVIKKVLLAAMKVTGDDFSSAYLCLATFQTMTPEEQLSAEAMDTDNWPEDEDPLSFAKRISTSGDGYEAVLERIATEAKQLQAELDAFSRTK